MGVFISFHVSNMHQRRTIQVIKQGFAATQHHLSQYLQSSHLLIKHDVFSSVYWRRSSSSCVVLCACTWCFVLLPCRGLFDRQTYFTYTYLITLLFMQMCCEGSSGLWLTFTSHIGVQWRTWVLQLYLQPLLKHWCFYRKDAGRVWSYLNRHMPQR